MTLQQLSTIQDLEKFIIRIYNQFLNDLKAKFINYEEQAMIDEFKLLKYKFFDLKELKMHKVLYFLYGFYYSKYNEELFPAEFSAWRYGPVELNYRNYRKDITNNFFLNFNLKSRLAKDREKIQFLKDKIIELFIHDVWTLVAISHDTAPWKNNYFNDNKGWKIIDKQEIFNYFLDENNINKLNQKLIFVN